jgi:hypothetical protein
MRNPAKNDIDILFEQNDQTLAEWWLLLNSWGWPEALSDPEPTVYIPDGKRMKLLDLIQKAIGDRLITKLHCKTLMTEEEFTVFYKAANMGCEEYSDEYWKQFNSRQNPGKTFGQRLTAIGERQLYGATNGTIFDRK